MKVIPLTGKHSEGKYAIVDDEDYYLVAGYKWRYDSHGEGYARRNTSNKTIHMHRLIMNAPKGMEVDHINGNGLDNRRCNLRICTRGQNSFNRKIPKNNTSGYKGVYWSEKAKKWHARIAIRGKRINLGFYSDKIDAAEAYDAAARKYYGEFACLNFL